MDREDIIRMAREAGISESHAQGMQGFLERFAFLVAAAERNKLAAWMIKHSYTTGHGETVEDLLKELEWQIAEREREACAKLCEANDKSTHPADLADAIRARRNT